MIAVAGLSARMLAESGRSAGIPVLALDLFGDRDTRRAARRWQGIGDAASLRISADALVAALREGRRDGRLTGWVPGGGFEMEPALVERGAAAAVLLGNPHWVWRRVKTPSIFFVRLTALGIPHPETRADPPAEPEGWLRKCATGTGGWHVRPLDAALGDDGGCCFYQRAVPGQPMSALFLANGSELRILGFNRQLVGIDAARPFVYRGVIGPVALPARLAERIGDALRALVAEFGLVGLNSLDFMVDGDDFSVLEINPRPSASMALHEDAVPGGLLQAHVEACRARRLPPPNAAPRQRTVIRGCETVFADRALTLEESAIGWLERRGWCHDIPAGAATVLPGQPVCTVSVDAADADAVAGLLAIRRDAVLKTLNNFSEQAHV
ncbi:ATP-grasp domain-containing protein [Derxia gummosa]|uniref:ATP-grasp domain-containing protein n=1 Tax=Derxia gummosa DSM 723 TaxID=1121388 RepID=A0A8B6XAS0_9BURK|nr:ATP-grasp domain-containing protein [Derxia gummosa]